MKTPHIHAELIKAWADGAEIEWFDRYDMVWKDCRKNFDWGATCEFRIKPEPKPDVVVHGYIPSGWTIEGQTASYHWFEMTVPFAWKEKYEPNLKLTFDGETGKLKSAEVI